MCPETEEVHTSADVISKTKASAVAASKTQLSADTVSETQSSEGAASQAADHFRLLNKGYLGELFDLEEKDWSQYSPLPLAYIGDAVYELAVRTVLVKRGNTKTQNLHRKATQAVRAQTQAEMIRLLLPDLTEEELAFYRRGRNAKPASTAKNASLHEYLEATGFETVIGYLYLKGEERRMLDLIRMGLDRAGCIL